jgi:two-component system copper resistance phosphate regulon response regulator CusR
MFRSLDLLGSIPQSARRMKILIVEDEPKTASFLQKGLSEEGYVVDVVGDGQEGLERAQGFGYDLIVLDVMMPKMDGWTFIERLRSCGLSTMTLFLTARDSLADRVRGLDLGADAYLVKPFSFTELLATVRTLLRRSSGRMHDILQIADLEIDFIQRRVQRNGERIELSPKEFSLLSLLARRRGEVVSRAVIADQVWNMNFDSETNVVDVHIARLRAKVDASNAKKLINTIRGMGYVLDEQK